MKAFLKNYRQSPRKVRLVAGAVKGKRIADAAVALSYMPKRAATPIKKLIESAVANAEAAGSRKEDLVVKSIEVNKGAVLKRWMPRAFGRSSPINKRTSHVQVELVEKAPKAKKQRSKLTEKK
ncbi:MAG TPA: 50S ribosomal protein L22 [Candidatus Paceibacterota bacterium]|nr:50S ribosomal protein L22 [Candidatus Paceibacterota bacterium]